METAVPNIVPMYHPDLNAVGEATLEGFHMLYAARGWELMEGPAADATALLGRPVMKVKDLTNDEIRQLLGSYGVEQPPAKATKNELIEMVSVVAGGQTLETDEDAGEPDQGDSGNDGGEPDDTGESDESKPSGAAKKAAAKKQGS